jgi:uncharacterized protein (DUF2164 family)
MDRLSLSRDDRALALERIREHLRDEGGEEPGDLSVLLWYDFIADAVAPLFYNEGIAAAQRVLLRAADAIDADLEAQKRPQPRPLRALADDAGEGARG